MKEKQESNKPRKAQNLNVKSQNCPPAVQKELEGANLFSTPDREWEGVRPKIHPGNVYKQHSLK